MSEGCGKEFKDKHGWTRTCGSIIHEKIRLCPSCSNQSPVKVPSPTRRKDTPEEVVDHISSSTSGTKSPSDEFKSSVAEGTQTLSDKITKWGPADFIYKVHIKTSVKKLKKEMTFEGINFGLIDWKTIRDKFVENLSKCEGKKDLERELGRIIDMFELNEIIDKVFGPKLI